MRRALGAALIALFTFFAVYNFTVAGMLVLDRAYGALYAHLIVAAIYLAAALVGLIVLLAARTKWLIGTRGAGALMPSREMRVAALIDAAMLGYAMACKSKDRGI